MSGVRVQPGAESLPAALRIFPLAGALLLPRGVLPLNIFEPRYLAMVEDALGGDRLIGMIQPAEDAAASDPEPGLRAVGCAGRITAFEEEQDGRYLIRLTGVSRFRIAAELAGNRGYRRVRPDWTAFADDARMSADFALDRARLRQALGHYLRHESMQADLDALTKAPAERLVTSLCMACPFRPAEKQALLEAQSWPERAEMLIALMEMAAHGAGNDGLRH